MSKFTMSKSAFEKLVKHLIEVEEGKSQILQQYFSAPTKERNEFERFIDNYIEKIDHLIRNVSKKQTIDDTIPFVTIGCEVEVKDLKDLGDYKFYIASPFHGGIKKGDISYLSPLGKSLLLKKVNDIVEVRVRDSVLHYEVKAIKLLG